MYGEMSLNIENWKHAITSPSDLYWLIIRNNLETSSNLQHQTNIKYITTTCPVKLLVGFSSIIFSLLSIRVGATFHTNIIGFWPEIAIYLASWLNLMHNISSLVINCYFYSFWCKFWTSLKFIGSIFLKFFVFIFGWANVDGFYIFENTYYFQQIWLLHYFIYT